MDVAELVEMRAADLRVLRRIDQYARGVHGSVYVPRSAAQEFKWLVDRAAVNVLPLVVDTIAQSLYVDGYRQRNDPDNAAGWSDWQINRMDAKQTGVHRAALTFGAAYVYVTPGTPAPIWRPKSPLHCTAVYSDPNVDEWPEVALLVDEMNPTRVQVVDSEKVSDYRVDEHGRAELTGEAQHNLGYVPVVRFVNRYDVDGRVLGEVSPLIPLQDQINFTTLGLMMAQQYAAFKQKWVTGMVIPEDESGRPIEPFNAAVNRLFVAEDPDSKFGEFGQTDLDGYLSSRESTLRLMATIAQVPPQHIGGASIANLSAEALASMEVQQTRKVAERKVLFGEAWEQTFRLSAAIRGDEAGAQDTSAQVVWRDTGARSLSQAADALGKLAQMLGVPVQMLWEDIPGWTQTDVERAKALAADGDSLAQLTAALTRQAAEPVAVADDEDDDGDNAPG